MAKKANTISQPCQQVLAPVQTSDFYNVPNSPATNLLLEVLGAGSELTELPVRKEQFNHNTTIEVISKDKKRKIVSTSPKAQITLEFSDIEKITGNNKPAKKLFVLALIKANEQAIFNGELGRDYVSFPLQELLDIGFYSSIPSARKGFKQAMDILTDIKLSGEIEKSKKRKISVIGLHPFRMGYIENNQCYIQLDSNFNWSFVAQYFTILPLYYFKLPNRASDLLYYIFYLARQNTKAIKERGYFTISFRSIQNRLQLPSEVGNRRPQQTIMQPIEDAIELLEKEHFSSYQNTEFALLPYYHNDTASVRDILENGYLKVSLSGKFSEEFIAISESTTKQIEAAKKKQERIMEQAVANNLSKALGSGQPQEDGSGAN